jgi:hypothetical protein
MAVSEPVKVKGAQIVTIAQMLSFASGLDERGDYNIPPDAMSFGRNVRINSANNATKRLSKRKWLPNSVGFNSEVSTVYYGGEIIHFIADDGKVKYCKPTDSSWTDCGGSNTITTDPGVITTFMRTNDWLLCMNGVDELRYINLSDLEMKIFTHVDDPTSTLTAAATGITTTGSLYVYYAISYNSDGGGNTAIGPILSRSVSKSRAIWNTNGSEYLTISFNDTPPAGAQSRTLWAATSLEGTTPQASDLVMLKSNIALADTSFVDNGSLPLIIEGGLAPSVNTTAGVKASAGVIAGKTPVLYGNPDSPYDIYFGTITEDGVSFGGEGTQTLPLHKGTNYYPTSVVGFRNNQNIPSLFVLSSGTEGVSKQSTITYKSVTYGNTVINYWDADDLNTGASAVYSRNGTVMALGELQFPSSQGITSIKTEQDLQNVLSPSIVSDPVADTYASIKNANFDKIIGASWNNLVMFAVPSRGFNYNNQILIRDMTNKQKPKWYIWDIPVDWIGAVSPPNADSFAYIRQGNKFYKLADTYSAEDQDSTGVFEWYPVVVEGALLPTTQARNSFSAATQAVVYLADFVGTVEIEVSYVNKKGKTKRKRKSFSHGSTVQASLGGWGNPRLNWKSSNSRMINWSTPIPFSDEANTSQKTVKRCRIRLPNPVINEAKFRVSSSSPGTSFSVVSGVIEGVTIGVIGDIV